MKKKIILLCIILFPSLIYLFFEMTKANFKKMAYFGPKVLNEKRDTVYYTLPVVYFYKSIILHEETATLNNEKINTVVIKSDSTLIDTLNYPAYLILFLNNKFKKEGYKLDGIYDFIKYKSKEFNDIPVLMVSDFTSAITGYKRDMELKGDFDSLKITLPNFHSIILDYGSKGRAKFLSETYFKQKPVYVFDYFAVLVDKQRHVRGYYDPTFNAEVKRMIADYKHLIIRDGYAQTLKQNDIKQNDEK